VPGLNTKDALTVMPGDNNAARAMIFSKARYEPRQEAMVANSAQSGQPIA
jgi:hypothetical protein